MAGAVPLEKGGPKADNRAVLLRQGGLLQVVRQIHQHFPLGIPIAAKFMQPFRRTEQKPAQLQLPRGEEAGGSNNVFAHSGINFVPELGKEQPILRGFCNFFNVCSIHHSTMLKKFPRPQTEPLTKQPGWGIMQVQRVPPADGSPVLAKRSNRDCGRCGGYFFLLSAYARIAKIRIPN